MDDTELGAMRLQGERLYRLCDPSHTHTHTISFSCTGMPISPLISMVSTGMSGSRMWKISKLQHSCCMNKHIVRLAIRTGPHSIPQWMTFPPPVSPTNTSFLLFPETTLATQNPTRSWEVGRRK